MASNQVGKTVQYNGHVFERIRILGKGSFGTAVVHKRQHDCALVVLKEIDLVELKRDADKLAAIQEAQIMSRLSHQNIIKYFNAYTTDTKLIIEMEYARLGTLQTYLSYQNRPLEELEIFQIFRQILFGLDYLHSKNIVHLDLKMANIFVTSEGSIKIGDFGIAKFISPSSGADRGHVVKPHEPKLIQVPPSVGSHRTGAKSSHHYQLGTLAYSSPERCLGESTDFKSDIWSLGCILYELATLRPLFASESLPELVLHITRVHHEPIQRADIRPAFKSLFEQMISRQPGDRPSAGELISSTDQLLLQLELTKTARCQQKTMLNRLPVNNHNVFGGHRQQVRQRNLAADLSTEGAALPLQHSLLYQVRLSSHDIQVDRVNLPQSKRIRELAKGRSHYLALTYDDIVYGWGTKHHGQLGACNLFSVNQPGQPRSPSLAGANRLRHTRSARNSLTARDLQLLSPSFSSAAAAATDHRHMSRAPPTPNRDRKLPASLTQPPSLSSSTQTILAPNHNNADHSGSSASLLASSNQQQEQRSRGHQFEMLFAAQPATRPIVVSELNKRKICRVAAGNDFSVFLSKTGIVLTCGDGSRGCLGRGSLASSFAPCMVDGLLNMDVVSIAAGPEHVVAVCSNGQAFAWGNSSQGRLGLSPERLQSGAGSHSRGSHYVVRPQLVDFKVAQPLSGLSKAISTSMSNQVFIKSAFCGDRCTIFIDSNHQCWACGQNRSNKLGMDLTRRFKRTILVQGSWLPVRISALAKERIVSCSIGRDHASYLTSEGKMIVFGQDIDHSYRLRMNLNAGSDQVRLKSWTNSHRASQLSLTSNHPNSKLPQARVHVMNEFDHESLIDLLLANNRLKNFKIPERDHKPPRRSIETSRFARKQVGMYLKMTRASKKMPFDEVVGISCTPKFSLALTNDNRIYFWGIRTHEMDDYGKTLSSLKCPPKRQDRPRAPSIEPQLVASCSDECFIKIGATNSSLMSTIQLLGSDQPIILARNPKLTAKSLADLWILDYEPPPSPGTDERLDQSSVNSSLSSLCSLSLSPSGLSSASCATLASDKSDQGGRRSSSQCSDSQCSELGPVAGWRGAANSRQCCAPENNSDDHEAGWSGQVDYKRHDAILEPQPIVSLYVPSMFNHSGCALQLANLFCFDEDRFFIVLDTTVKFQQPASFAPASSAPIPIGTRTQAHNSRRKSYCSFKTHHNQTGALVEHHQPHTAANQSARTKLNMVEELRSGGSSSQEQRNPRRNSAAGMERLSGNNESAPAQASDELCPLDSSSSEKQECCRDIKADLIESHQHVIYPTGAADDALQVGAGSDYRIVVEDAAGLSEPDGMVLVSQQISPVSHNCLSLEEPRSMSTFAPGFDGNHIAIVGPATPRDDDCESLRRLSFEKSQQLWNYEPSSGAAAQHLRQQTRNGHHQRQHRRRLTGGRARQRSESTVVTGGYEDDTSSMPTWVKNEYIQQMQCAQPIVGRQDGEPSNEDEGTTCVSEVTLTDANSGLQSSSTSLEGRMRSSTSDDDYDEREEEDGERTTELGWPHQANWRDSSPGCRIGAMRRASNPATESTCTGASTVLSQHLSRSQPDIKESVSRFPGDTNPDLGGDRAYAKLISENLLDCRVYRSVSVSSKQSAISEDCEGRLGSNLKTNEHGPMSASFGSEISQRDQLATSCHQLETYQPGGTTQPPSTAEEMDSRSRLRAGSLVDLREIHQQPIDQLSINERTSNRSSPRERTAISSSKNSNGLQRNILSQSAYLDTEFNGQSRKLRGDLNNNPIGRRPITRSRSSLSSIRKSLVRIFC